MPALCARASWRPTHASRSRQSVRHRWSNGDKTFTGQNTNLGAGYQVFSGNFDGSNGDDLFLYKPGSGADYIYFADAPHTRTFTPSERDISGTYTPVVGNFDNAGGDDIFWYSPGAGQINEWFFDSQGNFTGVNFVNVGTGFTPIAGNFDGASGDDIFWYLPGSGADLIWYSNGTQNMIHKTTTNVSGTGPAQHRKTCPSS